MKRYSDYSEFLKVYSGRKENLSLHSRHCVTLYSALVEKILLVNHVQGWHFEEFEVNYFGNKKYMFRLLNAMDEIEKELRIRIQ